jgi:cell division protein ZapA
MKTLIEVEIFGQTFTVTGEDEATYVRELAAFVDHRMRQIDESTKSPLALRVAIMAALSIADDYLKAQRQEAENTKQVEEISAGLLTRLEKTEKLDALSSASTPSIRDFSPLRATQE